MEKRLIARGFVAGAVAAVLAFLFARLFAEPVIGRAIAYEDGRTDAEDAHGVHEHGVELFTRGVQSNAGLGFGALIFGVAMGALFAVLFCIVYGRVGSVGARVLSIRLAAGAFVSVYLVPFVKYPPNPPAVGQSDTIGMRTGWYLVMVLASALLAAAAVLLARRLSARFGGWNGRLIAAVIYVVVVAVVMALLPGVGETPEPMRDASGVIIY
ncbi:MAG: CbtA family protein, partial [Mycobacterium sp.]